MHKMLLPLFNASAVGLVTTKEMTPLHYCNLSSRFLLISSFYCTFLFGPRTPSRTPRSLHGVLLSPRAPLGCDSFLDFLFSTAQAVLSSAGQVIFGMSLNGHWTNGFHRIRWGLWV